MTDKRYYIELHGITHWVVDYHRHADDDHPMALVYDLANANRICDALNDCDMLEQGWLTPGTWWRKCGITRRIVKVSEKHVHYETVPTKAVTRIPKARFVDWMDKAELVRIRQ